MGARRPPARGRAAIDPAAARVHRRTAHVPGPGTGIGGDLVRPSRAHAGRPRRRCRRNRQDPVRDRGVSRPAEPRMGCRPATHRQPRSCECAAAAAAGGGLRRGARRDRSCRRNGGATRLGIAGRADPDTSAEPPSCRRRLWTGTGNTSGGRLGWHAGIAGHSRRRLGGDTSASGRPTAGAVRCWARRPSGEPGMEQTGLPRWSPWTCQAGGTPGHWTC